MEITGQIQRCNVHLSITDQVIEKSGNEKSILEKLQNILWVRPIGKYEKVCKKEKDLLIVTRYLFTWNGLVIIFNFKWLI